MSTKQTIRLSGIVFMALLALSIPSALVAGDNGRPAHPGTGAWACVDDAGIHGISLSSLTNNGSGRSWTIDYLQMEPYLGTHASGKGEGFMTGHDTFENYNVIYYRLPDASVVGIVITRGKGRVVDADNIEALSKAYVFYPGLFPFTDEDADGVPDNYEEAVEVMEGSMKCKRLSTGLSSFPAPENYPPKP